MKPQDRRRAEGDRGLSDASRTEEERPESAQQPVALVKGSARTASTTQDDELLLQQQILRDHRPDAAGPTQLRGHDGEVQ